MNWFRPVTIDRCVCQRVLFSQLLPMVQEAAWSLEELVAQTGCGDQCGMCLPYLREMMARGATVFHEVLEPEEGSA